MEREGTKSFTIAHSPLQMINVIRKFNFMGKIKHLFLCFLGKFSFLLQIFGERIKSLTEKLHLKVWKKFFIWQNLWEQHQQKESRRLKFGFHAKKPILQRTLMTQSLAKKEELFSILALIYRHIEKTLSNKIISSHIYRSSPLPLAIPLLLMPNTLVSANHDLSILLNL